MQELCTFHDRSVYFVEGGSGSPAVFFIADRDAGGILINAPRFTAARLGELQTLAPVQILFLPSRFGAQDIARWRAAGVKTVAQPVEAAALSLAVDIPLDSKLRLTRTIDFLPMAGRTAGSCGLRLRNKPGAVFFGPILEQAHPHSWPTLVPHPDDHSWENRLFGCLGLQDIHYEYAFTDSFVPGQSPYGPGADQAIARALEELFAAD
ncbi:MAG: hypothetical protein JJ693_08360 [Acidithiobacillus sp.]|nr:hypothetical protein [Acidithiobacillus sp.]